MGEYIDRPKMKAEARSLLKDAQVRPRMFFLLYLVLIVLLDLASTLASSSSELTDALSSPLGLFVNVLTSLVSLILGVGCYLYCFAIRRGERAEYLTLFDGFSFAGKIILLYLVEYFFVALWSFLFVVPGFVALYRYRYAVLNLCENPSMGVMEAIDLSKRQTYGYKGQLFMLDLSYAGWIILANLPVLYFNNAFLLSEYGLALLPGLNMNSLLQTLLCDVFLLIFGLLYLPSYHATELGYFETAKRTSGAGSGVLPPDQSGTSGDSF